LVELLNNIYKTTPDSPTSEIVENSFLPQPAHRKEFFYFVTKYTVDKNIFAKT